MLFSQISFYTISNITSLTGFTYKINKIITLEKVNLQICGYGNCQQFPRTFRVFFFFYSTTVDKNYICNTITFNSYDIKKCSYMKVMYMLK